MGFSNFPIRDDMGNPAPLSPAHRGPAGSDMPGALLVETPSASQGRGALSQGSFGGADARQRPPLDQVFQRHLRAYPLNKGVLYDLRNLQVGVSSGKKLCSLRLHDPDLQPLAQRGAI